MVPVLELRELSMLWPTTLADERDSEEIDVVLSAEMGKWITAASNALSVSATPTPSATTAAAKINDLNMAGVALAVPLMALSVFAFRVILAPSPIACPSSGSMNVDQPANERGTVDVPSLPARPDPKPNKPTPLPL